MRPSLVEIFEHTYRDLRPRAAIPEFQVRFYHFSSINNTIRLREGRVLVRLSDLLEGAPEHVLRAIAHILLAKLYRRAIDPSHAVRYRRHVSSRDLINKSHLIRQIRGRKTITTARGRFYDLDEVFETLNSRYFHGLLARPILTWSRAASKQSLGHYDAAHNTIVISRVFDHAKVPRYAVEYIVYHEMLHLKHPVRLRGSRRCVHSPQFQADEKLFFELSHALQFLKRL